MKVYLVWSESYDSLLKEAGCERIIVSFGSAGWLSPWRLPRGYSDYLIDSGGYQIRTGKGNRGIWLGSYRAWLKHLIESPQARWISGYINLDTLDPDHTFENQLLLESVGLNPIPVWHDGEDEKMLTHYCENYRYVAVGGIANRRKGTPYYQNLAIDLTSKYPNVNFHFLGMGIAASHLRKYAPYSIDCGTYLEPLIRGSEIIVDENGHIKERPMNQEDKKKIRSSRKFQREKAIDAIRNIINMEHMK